MQLQSDLVDAGVERDHRGQRDPEVTNLQDAVEQRVVHVLDVALALRHWTVTDEVLPAYDRREEHARPVVVLYWSILNCSVYNSLVKTRNKVS